MNIGVKFEVPNEWGKLIKDILCGIDLEQYKWRIDQAEVYIKDNTKNNGYLFPEEKDILDNTEFTELISNFVYYTVFADIKAYPNICDFDNIKTYNDFKTSNCELIILVTDNIFVNIYAKSEILIEKIRNNALLNNYEKIEYIIEKN